MSLLVRRPGKQKGGEVFAVGVPQGKFQRDVVPPHADQGEERLMLNQDLLDVGWEPGEAVLALNEDGPPWMRRLQVGGVIDLRW